MSELEIWNELGNIYYGANAFERAINAYNKAIEQGSACCKSFSNLVSIYIRKEDYDAAVQTCRKGIESLMVAADQARMWKRLGDLHLGLDEYEQSIQDYQEALQLDPQNARLKDFLACAERALANPAPRAGSAFNLAPLPSEPEVVGSEFIQESSASGDPSPSEPESQSFDEEPIERLETQAETTALMPDKTAFEPAVEPAQFPGADTFDPLPSEPDRKDQPASEPQIGKVGSTVVTQMEEPVSSRAQALLKLGLLRWLKNDFEGALQFFQTALNLAAVFADTHFEALCFSAIARLEIDLKKPAEALRAYENAAALEPNNISAWRSLGALYSKSGQYEEALDAFKRAIESDSQDPLSWNGIADVYAGLGRTEEAISAYQLSNTLKGLKHDEDAIAMVRVASECPHVSPRILEEMGHINYINGAYQDAVDAYAGALELQTDPLSQSALWKKIGDAQRKLRRDEAANAAYQKATELDPAAVMLKQELIPAAQPAAIPQVEEVGEPLEAIEMPFEETLLEENESAAAEESTPVEEPAPVESAAKETEEDEEPYWVFRTTAPIVPPSREVEKAPQPAGFTLSAASPKPAVKPSPAFILPKLTSQPNLGNASTTGTLDDPSMLMVEENSPCEDAASAAVSPETEQAVYGFASETLTPAARKPASPEPEPACQDAPAPQPDALTLRNDINRYKYVTEQNPNNDRAWDALGSLYEIVGMHNEAITAFEKAICLASQREVYHYHLGLAYGAQKRYDKAIQALQKVVALNPEYMMAHCALAGYYRRLGREGEAREHIAIARPHIQKENDYNQACFESICGNIELSLNYLKKAVENKQADMDLLENDPDLDFIRTDPRFEALVNAQREMVLV